MNVLIFSGGTGSMALQSGFQRIYSDMINVQIVTNAYDNGLSTGAVRKAMDGRILGPSDVRKNQMHQANIGATKMQNDSYKKELLYYLSSRISAGSAKEMREKCLAPFDPKGDSRTTTVIDPDALTEIRKGISSFFSNQSSDLIKYHDFSIANIIYAGLAFQNNYSLEKASKIMAKVLKIPEDKVLLSSDESLFLQAVTEDSKLILDEGDIVSWSNPENKITKIRLVDEYGVEKIPELSEDVVISILNADLIIFSSGTQWSSLIPTYIHKDFYYFIKNCKAKKYLVMNNVADKDMTGVTSLELLDILKPYLPLEDINIVFNNEAAPDMQLKSPDYRCIEGSLSSIPGMVYNEPVSTHSTEVVNFIMSDYFNEYINVDSYIFDFDGTIIGRENKYETESMFNISKLYDLKSKRDCILVTGNSLKHVNKHLDRESFNEVYCDGGNSLCLWDDVVGMYKFKKYINKKYVMSRKEVKALYKVILEHDVPVYKIENRNDVIISIKPLGKEERKLKAAELQKKLRDKYDVKLNGRTTIDILKKGYNKTVIFDNPKFKDKSVLYVGDELEKGNDKPMRERKNVHFFPVKNPIETLTLLKAIK